MLYEYLLQNYKKDGEPILLAELEEKLGPNTRQKMKYLVDKNKVCRFKPGVYYLPYTFFGMTGHIDIETYIKKKYINSDNVIYGYITGYPLANQYGVTSQNPAVYEICTNKATTKQRQINLDGRKIVLYQPRTTITNENYKELQFLDFLLVLNKYSEIKGKELYNRIWEIIRSNDINIALLKQYLPYYPERIYKTIYEINCI